MSRFFNCKKKFTEAISGRDYAVGTVHLQSRVLKTYNLSLP